MGVSDHRLSVEVHKCHLNLSKTLRLCSYQHKQIRLSNFSKVTKSVSNRFQSMGILTQSGRRFPIHVCTVSTYHYYRHATMGEKITNQSFPSGGAVGLILEPSLDDQKFFAKIVMVWVRKDFGVPVSSMNESQYSPAILVSENDLFCLWWHFSNLNSLESVPHNTRYENN